MPCQGCGSEEEETKFNETTGLNLCIYCTELAEEELHSKEKGEKEDD